MQPKHSRKASSMSKWVRGIYNAAANFNMSKSIRAAAGRILDRDNKHVREECNKSDQHVESSQSFESSSATAACAGTASPSTRASSSSSGTSASSGRSTAATSINTKDGDLPNPHGTSCSCPSCRDYAEYTATFSSKGEGVSPWIRISNEPRSIKQTNTDAADRIEQCTGIPAGVTV